MQVDLGGKKHLSSAPSSCKKIVLLLKSNKVWFSTEKICSTSPPLFGHFGLCHEVKAMPRFAVMAEQG